ncbi:MAG: damage-inducible protein DinB [Burkholderiales bacterium]|jgi:uncharacterized damage-inducible protein DinB|nr:damage-inducible protein DinB [Burkholderiales bacterium]
MIDNETCRILAGYHRWMNGRLFAAAATLSDDERKRDRGAFFGSIHRTFAHLLWADRTWHGRFVGTLHPVAPYGADEHPDFDQLARERERTDQVLVDWANGLPQAWLDAPLEYRAASDGKLRRMPAWAAVVHLFNHGTHHRGQVTTLLKQAGVDPGVTDLAALPGLVERL